MNATYSRCTLPDPSPRGIIAARLDVDSKLAILRQMERFADDKLYPEAEEIAAELMSMGFCVEYIGFGRVPAGCIIRQAALRFWIFGQKIQLGSCGEEALQRLSLNGHDIAREKMRVAYGMPRGWIPPNTMNEVAPNVFRGCVVDDIRAVAVPIMNRGDRWAIWIAVRAENSNGMIKMPLYSIS